MLLHRHLPEARFAEWAFGCLFVLFAALGIHKPAVGLSGIGAILILVALIIEGNKDRIWDTYLERYQSVKQVDSVKQHMPEPNRLYYQLNVYFVWPLVFLVGLAAICVAYAIG